MISCTRFYTVSTNLEQYFLMSSSRNQIFGTSSIVLLFVEESILPTRLFIMFQKSFQVLNLPGNSPDVNSFENLWSTVKRRVRNMDFSTKKKIIEDALNVLFRDDGNKKCSKLIESMPKRV
ncbi:hypothetical protein AVEN_41740-1 [Araneus ventricosus]|uniref:Tc1-like transposase DDE domain-containing protein n=1 Tax=Araneus ventricosus TaxID=182803 RepID=A0A4Y2ACF7_ARAVE|nr:hypothetical protein AVEN_41740-1 [Araneus ventricosus]